jgi:hypothetical protein
MSYNETNVQHTLTKCCLLYCIVIHACLLAWAFLFLLLESRGMNENPGGHGDA